MATSRCFYHRFRGFVIRGIQRLIAAGGFLLLASCGGGATTATGLAADACGILSELSEAGPELFMDQDAMDDFEADVMALQERAEDSDIDDEEMESAMRDECPEVVDAFGGLLGE